MRRTLLFPILLPCALAAGCSDGEDSIVDVTVIGTPGSQFTTGSRLPFAAQLLRGATAEGLVALDEQGRITSAVADRWIVTDDGLSYIFRLRDGRWPDGSAISAESVRAALRQAIAALRGTPMAVDLESLEDIRTMTGRVIELRLERPHPELLQLLAQPELGLLRNGRGTGPMMLRPAGAIAVLTPIAPEKRGLSAVDGWAERVRTLRLRALPGGAAVERFNLGRSTLVLGGRIESYPFADAVGISRGAIKLEPVAGLFGLAMAHGDGFLSLPANREAIAMAIDRDAIFGAFRAGGWVPTNRVISEGVEDDPGSQGERWTGQSLAVRRGVAAGRVGRWIAARGEPVRLRIALPVGPGADRIFARLADDFRQVGLVAVRVGEGDVTDLRLIDAVARYPRTLWYLNQFACRAQRGLCDAAADAAAIAAEETSDPAQRRELLGKAVAAMTNANIFIPFGPPLRWSLVSGNATGFVANSLGYHPLMSLTLRPK